MSLRLHFFKTIVFIFFISFSVKGQVLVSGIINQKSGLALNESTIKVFSQDSLYIIGTKTDIDGNFNLYLPNKKESSAIGYLFLFVTFRAPIPEQNAGPSVGP